MVKMVQRLIKLIRITSRTLQSPFTFLQRLCFVEARASFTMTLKNLIPFYVHAQIVVLQEFARSISIIVRECHELVLQLSVCKKNLDSGRPALVAVCCPANRETVKIYLEQRRAISCDLIRSYPRITQQLSLQFKLS